MPVAADVVLLLGLLAHLGDHRIALDRREEAVDVDGAPALGEGDVLLGRKLLVAEEDDAVRVIGAANLGELLVVRPRRQVGASDLGAQR